MEPHRDTLVIRAVGELDLATAPDFARAVAGPAGSGFPRLVLDLRELAFCDSTGLRAILDLLRIVPAATRFEVIRGEEPIQRLLEVTGAKAVLRFVEAADAGL